MPPREETEQEKEREYVKHQLVEGGTKLQGDKAGFTDEMGAVGEVKRRREKDTGGA